MGAVWDGDVEASENGAHQARFTDSNRKWQDSPFLRHEDKKKIDGNVQRSAGGSLNGISNTKTSKATAEQELSNTGQRDEPVCSGLHSAAFCSLWQRDQERDQRASGQLSPVD